MPTAIERPERARRRALDGWLILDKPVGPTSTRALAICKRMFGAEKAGHAGTLDPLASGILPLAFGEATKAVPYVQDGAKTYRFDVAFGSETTTDDLEGEIVARSGERPSPAEVAAALPAFVGQIAQAPPAYSAILVDGERAYARARAGETVEIAPRPVRIDALRLVACDGGRAMLEVDCGKGTYVRALARDLGRRLGCFGHVAALRRLRVGPFDEGMAVALADVEAGTAGPDRLLPVIAGLAGVQRIEVDAAAAALLRQGRAIFPRGAEAPAPGVACAARGGEVVAVGEVAAGAFNPTRVFAPERRGA